MKLYSANIKRHTATKRNNLNKLHPTSKQLVTNLVNYTAHRKQLLKVFKNTPLSWSSLGKVFSSCSCATVVKNIFRINDRRTAAPSESMSSRQAEAPKKMPTVGQISPIGSRSLLNQCFTHWTMIVVIRFFSLSGFPKPRTTDLRPPKVVATQQSAPNNHQTN